MLEVKENIPVSFLLITYLKVFNLVHWRYSSFHAIIYFNVDIVIQRKKYI